MLVAEAPVANGVSVWGPAPAPLAMIRGQSRMRIAIHAERTVNVQAFLRAWLEKPKLPPGIGLSLDIDPQSFL
jgi:primosomal protein N' (replication factor Y)